MSKSTDPRNRRAAPAPTWRERARLQKAPAQKQIVVLQHRIAPLTAEGGGEIVSEQVPTRRRLKEPQPMMRDGTPADLEKFGVFTIDAAPYKPAHGGKRKGAGRKALALGQKSEIVTVRMSPAQRAKLKALGGSAWVREQVDRAKEPR